MMRAVMMTIIGDSKQLFTPSPSRERQLASCRNEHDKRTTGRCVSLMREGIPTSASADRHLVDTGRFCGLRLHAVHEMEHLLSNQYNRNK
jgi:hypothetical protein